MCANKPRTEKHTNGFVVKSDEFYSIWVNFKSLSLSSETCLNCHGRVGYYCHTHFITSLTGPCVRTIALNECPPPHRLRPLQTTPTNACHAPFSFHLHHHAPHCIDAPGLPVVVIAGIARHGVGYRSGVAIDPVLVYNIMAVCTC